MTRAEILTLAQQYVTQDRNHTHGEPEDNFGLIADYWGVYLSKALLQEVALTAIDVAMLMALFKVARQQSNCQHMDNYTDGVGYLACAGEIASKL